ncbi:hypothetical protein BT69DRAFT_1345577 [Atractiella rhizophila]|nr:hypothetical protein BT69DRAFT_1345577 [Atractiella rhizophila]
MSCSPPPPPNPRRNNIPPYPAILKRSYTAPQNSKTRSVLDDITSQVTANSNFRSDGTAPNPFMTPRSRRRRTSVESDETENMSPRSSRVRRAVTMPLVLPHGPSGSSSPSSSPEQTVLRPSSSTNSLLSSTPSSRRRSHVRNPLASTSSSSLRSSVPSSPSSSEGEDEIRRRLERKRSAELVEGDDMDVDEAEDALRRMSKRARGD